MDMSLWVPLAITAALTILGWFAAHRLAAARDRANKRREMRTSFLLDAYRRLEFASHRPTTPEVAHALESALGDIQLMGSPTLAALVPPYIAALNNDPNSSPGPLLVVLRDELRHELDLPPLPPDGFIARISREHIHLPDEQSPKRLTGS